MDFLDDVLSILYQDGYVGDPIRYLLCFRVDKRSMTRKDEPEFLAVVTPEQTFKHQVWEMSSMISFDKDHTRLYEVDELTESEANMHIAFETLRVIEVHACTMSGGD